MPARAADNDISAYVICHLCLQPSSHTDESISLYRCTVNFRCGTTALLRPCDGARSEASILSRTDDLDWLRSITRSHLSRTHHKTYLDKQLPFISGNTRPRLCPCHLLELRACYRACMRHNSARTDLFTDHPRPFKRVRSRRDAGCGSDSERWTTSLEWTTSPLRQDLQPEVPRDATDPSALQLWLASAEACGVKQSEGDDQIL